MAFKRIVEMKAGTSDTSVIISGLDISFEITRTRNFSNNVAKFVIYNPLDDTVNKMLKKGNSITFKAGYEDEGIGLIYIGQITQSIPTKSPPDNIVTIECGSTKNTDNTNSSVTVSLGYKKGTNISRPIKEMATALGLAVIGIENVSNITLANGFTLAGTAKEALRFIQNILKKNGCGLFIDNVTLKIFKKGVGENIKAVTLSNSTGLLEAPKLTDNTAGDESVQEQLTKRVLFKSILNYNIIPNGYINIIYTNVNGVYLVDKCSFKGDNFGGEYYVSGEGIGE